jgi:glycosyltransferase involved in cell wall biosynthesis
VGRLAAAEQERHYARAQWYLSLPESDSVAVSVLEAMGHGCIPLLSDLPANRELVEHGRNGLILRDAELAALPDLEALLGRAQAIARDNRAWVQQHGLFAPAIARLLARLGEAV